MIDTTFACAPAGVLGSGSVDVRPNGWSALRPSLVAPVSAVQGTGVPFAGMARVRTAVPTATKQHIELDPNAQNDGTTLGNHSSGRPAS